MSALSKIAHFQNRRDEVPNQELAKELATSKDQAGIAEIAHNMWNKNTAIQSDCVKVLYEVGYLDPLLIADYKDDFLKLVKGKNNRLVWGGMIALSTIAPLKADELYAHGEELQKIVDKGSVITVDNGILTLAIIASGKDAYRQHIFSYLLKHLESCRPKDLPQRAEKIVRAVDSGNKAAFLEAISKRMDSMTASQITRLKRVIKQAEAFK